jgi:subtilase family serine protease
VPIPADVAAGTYFVIGKADADGLVAETNEGNNTSARSVAVGPDLTVPAFTVPFAVVAGADVVVNETVLNQGAGAAAPTLTRFYLSLNGSVDASDVQLEGSRPVPGLAAGESSAGSTVVTIPAGAAPGTYYVVARADAGGAVTETSEGNNVRARVVKVAAAP